jgi:hypothetical protein
VSVRIQAVTVSSRADDRHVIDHVGDLGFLDVPESTRDGVAAGWAAILEGRESHTWFEATALGASLELDSAMSRWLDARTMASVLMTPEVLRVDPWVPRRSRDVARLESAQWSAN